MTKSPRAGIRIATHLAALATLAGGVATVSGCGTSATLDPVARAAAISSQQAGALISLTTQISSPAIPGGTFSVTADGYLDERNRSGELTMDLSKIPGASTLPGGGAGTVEILFEYPTIYMHMPFLAGELPEGKTWLKLDLTKAAQATGVSLPQLSSVDQTDPAQLLDYLRASSGGVTKVGSERLDGVATTHYQATLQLSGILDRLPSSEQAAAKAALEKLGDRAGGIPVDVWVDAQGRVRRIELSIGEGAGSETGASGTITIDYKSYGPVPPIAAPPSGEVLDESSLIAAGVAAARGG